MNAAAQAIAPHPVDSLDELTQTLALYNSPERLRAFRIACDEVRSRLAEHFPEWPGPLYVCNVLRGTEAVLDELDERSLHFVITCDNPPRMSMRLALKMADLVFSATLEQVGILSSWQLATPTEVAQFPDQVRASLHRISL